MEAAGDRVFLKTGAEGVYCAAIPAAGLGVALKALDGGKRAAEAAIVRVLEELGVLRPDEVERLRPFARPEVLNTRSETVGEIRADFRLQGGAPGRSVVAGPV
jgi:L-asparaginase II